MGSLSFEWKYGMGSRGLRLGIGSWLCWYMYNLRSCLEATWWSYHRCLLFTIYMGSFILWSFWSYLDIKWDAFGFFCVLMIFIVFHMLSLEGFYDGIFFFSKYENKLILNVILVVLFVVNHYFFYFRYKKNQTTMMIKINM